MSSSTEMINEIMATLEITAIHKVHFCFHLKVSFKLNLEKIEIICL
ncbi:hypothetical protein [Borreliella garinii]|nr:hypothetical protein [Borreliella garinii]WNZ71103.1 hypothetical protein PT141_04550 [Borreliella garinii]